MKNGGNEVLNKRKFNIFNPIDFDCHYQPRTISKPFPVAPIAAFFVARIIFFLNLIKAALLEMLFESTLNIQSGKTKPSNF
ncbi:hypothetical protein BAZO_16209 [Schinkia azotoformans LMG 9581]|uniref:Uncharacterized protein n=1 Tax=Schinkia azotoformans LMG 9581 TaxID=1131731 RepID=K6D6S2_SCHAZ|nr:hypothetical protein BAZO_16209 [Schinkia azotoformans LMG 9581]